MQKEKRVAKYNYLLRDLSGGKYLFEEQVASFNKNKVSIACLLTEDEMKQVYADLKSSNVDFSCIDSNGNLIDNRMRVVEMMKIALIFCSVIGVLLILTLALSLYAKNVMPVISPANFFGLLVCCYLGCSIPTAIYQLLVLAIPVNKRYKLPFQNRQIEVGIEGKIIHQIGAEFLPLSGMLANKSINEVFEKAFLVIFAISLLLTFFTEDPTMKVMWLAMSCASFIWCTILIFNALNRRFINQGHYQLVTNEIE